MGWQYATLSIITLSITVVESVMLGVTNKPFKLSVIMLNVIMLNVIMLYA